MSRAYWEILYDEIAQAGWSIGYTAALFDGVSMFVVDAKKDHTPRYFTQSEDRLLAFQDLQRLTQAADGQAGLGKN